MNLLLQGFQMTLQLMSCSAILSFILGTLLGLGLSNPIRIKGASLISVFTFICRATPFYVLLLLIYFGGSLEPFTASIIALGISSSGYVSEIVRAAINAVPKEQWESAQVLSLGRWTTLRRVIFPQALQIMLPNLCNELESIAKSTSIAASIGLVELTRASMNLVSREMDPIPIYLSAAAFYVFISFTLRGGLRVLTKKLQFA